MLYSGSGYLGSHDKPQHRGYGQVFLKCIALHAESDAFCLKTHRTTLKLEEEPHMVTSCPLPAELHRNHAPTPVPVNEACPSATLLQCYFSP